MFIRNIIFFSLGFVCFCFEAFCMKSISIDMQGVNGRQLIAKVDPFIINDPVLSLRNSSDSGIANSIIHLNDGVFSIILRQNVFDRKFVNVVEENTGNPLFSVVVEKTHSDCQPTVSLTNVHDIHCALYRQRSGGGNAFILAISDVLEEVSLKAVKSRQHYGQMQALMLVSQL